MTRIAVFASGNGSNFEAIVRQANGYQVAILITDQPGATVLKRAEVLKVPAVVVDYSRFKSKKAVEKQILNIIQPLRVTWIILAGYMRILGNTLLSSYPNHILNIHPALLPSFPGKDAIQQALDQGASETGVTIHYVDHGIDTGKIIVQEAIPIPPGADVETVASAIHQIEHRLYPTIIARLIKEESR